MKSVDYLIIRTATMQDIAGLNHLLEQLFMIEEDFEVDQQKQRAGLKLIIESSSAHVLVAELDKSIIGMVTMQLLISTAEGTTVGLIEDMVIDDAFRHKGVGTRLLKEMEMLAQKLGCARIQLLADQTNLPALNFYEKNHWKTTNLICLRKSNQIK